MKSSLQQVARRREKTRTEVGMWKYTVKLLFKVRWASVSRETVYRKIETSCSGATPGLRSRLNAIKSNVCLRLRVPPDEKTSRQQFFQTAIAVAPLAGHVKNPLEDSQPCTTQF